MLFDSLLMNDTLNINMDRVEKNNIVTIHYTLTFTDGRIYDTSPKGKPVTFQNSTYWMGPEVIISTAEKGKVRAFGRVWDFDGRSAELCQIKWGTH